MTLSDIYCPPIPEGWKQTPRILIEEGKRFTCVQIIEREKLNKAKKADKRTSYYRQWAAEKKEKYNRQRRDKHAVTMLAKRQEEMRSIAVRTMVNDVLFRQIGGAPQ